MKEPPVKAPAAVRKQKEKKRQQAPAHVFLLPSERKYPYKRWKNGEWVISCADLRDAIRLAAFHGHRKVLQKAQAIYAKECGGER